MERRIEFEEWMEMNKDNLIGCYEVMDIDEVFDVWCLKYWAKQMKVKLGHEQLGLFSAEAR